MWLIDPSVSLVEGDHRVRWSSSPRIREDHSSGVGKMSSSGLQRFALMLASPAQCIPRRGMRVCPRPYFGAVGMAHGVADRSFLARDRNRGRCVLIRSWNEPMRPSSMSRRVSRSESDRLIGNCHHRESDHWKLDVNYPSCACEGVAHPVLLARDCRYIVLGLVQ